MTYSFVTIELAVDKPEGKTYTGKLRLQNKIYRFNLINATEPRCTRGSHMTIEDDAQQTLQWALRREYHEDKNTYKGTRLKIGNFFFHVQVRLSPANFIHE